MYAVAEFGQFHKHFMHLNCGPSKNKVYHPLYGSSFAVFFRNALAYF